ncbi:MAG: hypothetical protein DRI94_12505 [Bacteroidetes bacterium]|nr:MAG: hypothetical protein DRI94_12505 [Bacteroidota bacterium]
MRKILFASFVALLFFASCNTNTTTLSQKEKDRKEIQSIDSTLYAIKDSFNTVLAKQAMIKFADFAENYQNDSLAANYLFKSAQLAQSLNLGSQTIIYLDKIITKYPNFKKISTCYFLKGFVYDNILQDIKNAKKSYQEFIDKFPNDDFVDDAAALLENLGKSPAELIKSFEDKNKKHLQDK